MIKLKKYNMTLLTSTILALGIMGCSFIEKDIPASKVPIAVKDALVKEYNNPLDVEWEKKKGNYEADFEIENIDHSAVFNKDGQLLNAKKDIEESALPAAITQKISAEYPDHIIDDADKVETEGKTLYQVELESTFRDRKVVYTTDGEVEKNFKYWD